MKTGDSLIVEPEERSGDGDVMRGGSRRGKRKKMSMVEKAEAKLRGREKGRMGGTGKSGVVGLGDIGRPKGRKSGTRGGIGKVVVGDDDDDGDDVRDKDWEEGGTDGEEEEEEMSVDVKGGGKGVRRSKRRRRVAGTGEGLGAGGFDPLGMGAVQEGLGVELVKSLMGDESKLDATGKKLKGSLQAALEEREKEAEGERRYGAWVAKKYRFEYMNRGTEFKVEIVDVLDGGGKWKQDVGAGIVEVFGEDVLKGVFEEVFAGGEEMREKLRESEMAKFSPRIFWNMARLFPEGVEQGLKKMLPEKDWDFLKSRRKMLSEKGRRNVENKEMMGWESD